MLDPRETELRQIKRLLVAILVCVAVIIVILAPALLPVALSVGGIYLLAIFGIAMAQTTRFIIVELWATFSSLWRR